MLPVGVLVALLGPIVSAQTSEADRLKAVPRTTVAELKALIAKGEGQVVIVDVRSVEGYRLGHLPGAIAVPLDTVADRAAELKALSGGTKAIVTYCS